MTTFAINFDGGLGLVNTCLEVSYIISNESGVSVKGLPTRELAYVYACETYVERELKKNPYVQPILPRLEDLDFSPIFRSWGFIPQRVSQRFFAAVHPEVAGIFTSHEKAVEFLGLYSLNSHIYEMESIGAAQRSINYYYWRYILPMGAYITEPIPYCSNILIDTVMQMPYADWIRNHCMVERKIPFEQYPLSKPLTQIARRVSKPCTGATASN